MLWTHGVYRNKVVPQRLDEAMPHKDAHIVITLRGNRLKTRNVETFTRRSALLLFVSFGIFHMFPVDV